MFNTELKEELKRAERDREIIERNLERLREDFDLLERNKDAEISLQVKEKTKELEEANAQLRQRIAVAEAELKILNAAFDNMGFDVKDMKEILNKLVDGLVAKHEIKLINNSK